MDWIKEKSVSRKKVDGMRPEDLEDKYVLGTFIKTEKPVFNGSSVC